MRSLSSAVHQVTKQATINGIINALGGLPEFCRLFAASYKAAKPGTAVRARLDAAVLSAINNLAADDTADDDLSPEELEEAARALLAQERANEEPPPGFGRDVYERQGVRFGGPEDGEGPNPPIGAEDVDATTDEET